MSQQPGSGPTGAHPRGALNPTIPPVLKRQVPQPLHAPDIGGITRPPSADVWKLPDWSRSSKAARGTQNPPSKLSLRHSASASQVARVGTRPTSGEQRGEVTERHGGRPGFREPQATTRSAHEAQPSVVSAPSKRRCPSLQLWPRTLTEIAANRRGTKREAGAQSICACSRSALRPAGTLDPAVGSHGRDDVQPAVADASTLLDRVKRPRSGSSSSLDRTRRTARALWLLGSEPRCRNLWALWLRSTFHVEHRLAASGEPP